MYVKNHVKKQYGGIQIDVYHGLNGYWYAFIPNRVNFNYKTVDYKTKDMAIKDCQQYIDQQIQELFNDSIYAVKEFAGSSLCAYQQKISISTILRFGLNQNRCCINGFWYVHGVVEHGSLRNED